jgi:hypothetical protein
MLRFLGESNRNSTPTSTHTAKNLSVKTTVTALQSNTGDGKRLKYFIGRKIQLIMHQNSVLTKDKLIL